jgi:hypothetical protein
MIFSTRRFVLPLALLNRMKLFISSLPLFRLFSESLVPSLPPDAHSSPPK